MLLTDFTKEEIKNCFNNIDNYLSELEQKWVRYVDLGVKTVRLVSYSDEFLPLVEKQLTYTLRTSSPKYDATLFLWNEKDVILWLKKISPKFDPKTNIRLRIDMLYTKRNQTDLRVLDKDFSEIKPLIDIQSERGFFIGNDYENNNYYYGVKNLDPEEFIKEGHIFVQFFNLILKTSTTNLVHGAATGLNGNGILFCARGQRGKSTLAVLSMMEGFEYVSDDYLTIEKDGDEIYTYPIYSIITLSPRMYNELYDKLDGSRFVSNNARKDKYVINISNYHNTFKTKYQIKVCMFPEIVSDAEPSIVPCTAEEKGRAITQLIQSTLMQMSDMGEISTSKKILDMVKDFDFYKINLCNDIHKNTEYLKDFMNNFEKRERKIIDNLKIYTDITFELAHFINSETGTIYSMNLLTTDIFENFLKGVSKEAVMKELKQFEQFNENIEEDFEILIKKLEETEIFKFQNVTGENAKINYQLAKDSEFKLSLIEYTKDEYIQLVKKENKNG